MNEKASSANCISGGATRSIRGLTEISKALERELPDPSGPATVRWDWLGCRDSNPNYLFQRQASYR